jgi:hypothetical protein
MSETPITPIPPADPPDNQGGGDSPEFDTESTTAAKVAADPPDNQGGG